MNVTEIVKAYLVEHGFDGLVSSDGECGCNLTDLIPDTACGEDDCEPGYIMPCTCAEGHDYHITTDRAKALAARAEKPSRLRREWEDRHPSIAVGIGKPHIRPAMGPDSQESSGDEAGIAKAGD